MLRIDENGNVFINGKNVNEIAKEAKPEIKTRTRRRIVRNGKVIQDEFVDSNNSGFPEELFDQFHSTSTNHTVVIRNGQVIQNDIVTDNENFNEEEFKKEYYIKIREFLKSEYSQRTIFPSMYDIFNALKQK